MKLPQASVDVAADVEYLQIGPTVEQLSAAAEAARAHARAAEPLVERIDGMRARTGPPAGSAPNAGDWQTWLTLFQEDVVIDEQPAFQMLAGIGEGQAQQLGVASVERLDGFPAMLSNCRLPQSPTAWAS